MNVYFYFIGIMYCFGVYEVDMFAAVCACV
jgi:hypothetical protein